uniref:Uncharacterized protein n=1 Tax=Eutreptiella gymnastica TaxID=73025 RepID=A0A7S1JF68_9EUGL
MPEITFANDTSGVASELQGQILHNGVTVNAKPVDHEMEPSSSTSCVGVCSMGLEDHLLSSMSQLEAQIATRNTEERLLADRLLAMKTFLDSPCETMAPPWSPMDVEERPLERPLGHLDVDHEAFQLTVAAIRAEIESFGPPIKEMSDEQAHGQNGEDCMDQMVNDGVSSPTIIEPTHAMTSPMCEPIAKGETPSLGNNSLIQFGSDAPSILKPPSTITNLLQGNQNREGDQHQIDLPCDVEHVNGLPLPQETSLEDFLLAEIEVLRQHLRITEPILENLQTGISAIETLEATHNAQQTQAHGSKSISGPPVVDVGYSPSTMDEWDAQAADMKAQLLALGPFLETHTSSCGHDHL